MPPIKIDQEELKKFGQKWKENRSLSRSPPYSSMDLGHLLDKSFADAIAEMLGGIPIKGPISRNSLLPPNTDCVELGDFRIIGGVRPQNFDVGYRPDGVRIAFDSKTLNDEKSVGKNWQNMVNDLSTEATTVHYRFPQAVVAFLVAIPSPCISGPRRSAMIETLERLGSRFSTSNAFHLAEAVSLVIWEPDDGSIDQDYPEKKSPLRIEKFAEQIESTYVNRYKGLPPHALSDED